MKFFTFARRPLLRCVPLLIGAGLLAATPATALASVSTGAHTAALTAGGYEGALEGSTSALWDAAGTLTAGMGTAAAASAPAPQCNSTSSQLSCLAPVPVSSVNWTATVTVNGGTFTGTTPGPAFISGACEVGVVYQYSYSYDSSGISFASPVTTITCSR
jgi:hypothetical protein